LYCSLFTAHCSLLTAKAQPTSSDTVWTISPHTSINDIAFSNDGSFIVVNDWQFNLIFYDTKTGNKIDSLPKQGGYKIKFIPNTNNLLAILLDNSIKIWNVPEKKVEKTLTVTNKLYRGCDITFTIDGRNIAAIDDNGQLIHIWDVNSGTKIKQIPITDYDILDIEFTENGKYLKVDKFNSMGSNNQWNDILFFNVNSWDTVYSSFYLKQGISYMMHNGENFMRISYDESKKTYKPLLYKVEGVKFIKVISLEDTLSPM
jgi:WD40 repeat protein